MDQRYFQLPAVEFIREHGINELCFANNAFAVCTPYHIQCIDNLRHQLYAPAAAGVQEPEEAGLFAALGELEPEYRALLHLRYYEGFSAAELARQFGTTAPALSARLYRAKRQLRKKLEELGYEEAVSKNL